METNIASQDNSATPLLNFRASQMKAARSSDDGLQLDMEGNGGHFPILQMFFKLKKTKNKKTSLIPHGKFGLVYLGTVTAATRATLPIPTHVCSVFMCPNSGMAVSV